MNRALTPVSLAFTRRKLFEILAKEVVVQSSRGNCTKFEPGPSLVLKLVNAAMAEGGFYVPADKVPDEIRAVGKRRTESGSEGIGEGESARLNRNRSRLTFMDAERLVVRVWEVVGTLFPVWWTESQATAGKSMGKWVDAGFQRGPKTLSDFENPLPDSKSRKEKNGGEVH